MKAHSIKKKPAKSLGLQAGETIARWSINNGSANVLQVSSFRKCAAPNTEELTHAETRCSP